MKTLRWAILLAVVLVACRRSEPVFPAPNDLEQVPFRIKTIRKQVDYGNPNFRGQDFTTVYRYDSVGRVAFIEDAWWNRDLEYQYRGDKLVARLTYERDSLVFRETFEYDAQGKLTRLNWTGNGSRHVQTFRYNAEGRIEEVRFEALTYTYARVTRYVWKNGNAVAQYEFDGTGKPQSEWTTEYDSAPNPYALSPADPDVPLSRNNPVRSTLTRDYTGLIDLIANPVVMAYTYTPESLPRQKRYNYSRRTETFTYESR